MFGMARLVPTLIRPALDAQMHDWSPLSEPHRLIDFLRGWKALLWIQPKRSNGINFTSQNTETLIVMIDEVIFSKLRNCLLREWDVEDVEPCVHLVESLRTFLSEKEAIISERAVRDLLQVIVFPRLKRAVESWEVANGFSDARIDLWIHPWLPHLSSELAALYPTIRRKLVAALDTLNCIHTDAVALVKPWMSVFDSKVIDSMSIQIGSKLAAKLRDFDVDPSQQQFEVLDAVLTWNGILSDIHMRCLLQGEFFPKWHKVLHEWLCRTITSYDADIGEEIISWYTSWKRYFASKLQLDGAILAEFGHALDIMLFSKKISYEEFIKVAPTNIVSYAALVRSYRVQYLHNDRPSKVVSARAIPVSFKTVVAEFAEQEGIEFVPKHGRTLNGFQLFSFGGVTCYLDTDVAHVEMNAKEWNPVSLEQLLELARSRKK